MTPSAQEFTVLGKCWPFSLSQTRVPSGKKLSIVPVRSPTRPSPAPSSRKSAQQKVRGNHACHSATPRNSSPRGSPAAISFSPSRLSHLLFAQTQVSNSSVPTAAFVSSFSKFLTPGRRARERRTAGGTFFPPAGGGRRGAGECAPSLCAPAGGTRGGQGDNGHKASPKWLTQLERRPARQMSDSGDGSAVRGAAPAVGPDQSGEGRLIRISGSCLPVWSFSCTQDKRRFHRSGKM